MNKYIILIIATVFIFFIFLTHLKLINQPLHDNDESIYMTTFLLINKGFPPYKETFMSQPPGYILSVYPGFLFFGKTLQAARLTIGLWSLIGLLAILWICIELNNPLAGILTLALLYFNSQYFQQTVTFQSDALVPVFSLISLAALIRFTRNKNYFWIILSGFFLNLSFWTKFDFFLLPSLIFIIFSSYKNKKNLTNLVSTYLLTSILFLILFIFPFGLNSVMNNTLSLRLSASDISSQSFTIFNYLQNNLLLYFLLIGSLILFILNKQKFNYKTLPLFLWSLTIFIFLLFYKPLFPHHLIILIVPATLLFSYLATISLKRIFNYYYLIIPIILFISAINYLSVVNKTSTGILNKEQQMAVDIINKNTTINDHVVTDEEILNYISCRLPPPQLSDVSFVRIKSNNLSPQIFKQIIDNNKPKLIIPWNGRLESIKGFYQLISNYKPLVKINNKTIYIIK